MSHKMVRLLIASVIPVCSFAVHTGRSEAFGIEPHRIVSGAGSCLDSTVGVPFLQPCKASAAQTWDVYRMGGIADNSFLLRTSGDQKCLDAGQVYVPGNAARLTPCNYDASKPNSQLWRSITVLTSPIGRYYQRLYNDYAGYSLTASWTGVVYMSSEPGRSTPYLWSAYNLTHGWEPF